MSPDDDPIAGPEKPPAADGSDESLAETEHERSGVVFAEYDPGSGEVLIDFDPSQISRPEVESYAGRIAPLLRSRYNRCTFRLTGRACESCGLRLEKRARSIEGVAHAAVSFAGGLMSVTFDPSVVTRESIADRVRAMGAPVTPPCKEGTVRRGIVPFLQRHFGEGWHQALLVVLTLATMVPAWFAGRAGYGLLAALLYTVAYASSGWYGVQAVVRSLRQRAVDIDLLMVLAALGAAAVGAPFEGAMLLFLFSLSNVLQGYAVDRARNAIRALMSLRPKAVTLVRPSGPESVPVDRVVPGDTVLVRPGDRIALDGVVTSGDGYLDESPITGESLPVHRPEGSQVLAGSICTTSSFEYRVTRPEAESTVARLVRMVEEAQSEKARSQRFLEGAEQYYAGGVLSLTALLIVVPPVFLGAAFADAFYRAMTVMVVASPCALILSTPASILSAIGGAARRGILFKGGAHLERLASVTTIAFDKTGTLTMGKPSVVSVRVMQGAVEDEVMRRACAVEHLSQHPLAKAIVAESAKRGIEPVPVTRFTAVTGRGAQGVVEGVLVRAGSLDWMKLLNADGFAEAEEIGQTMTEQGQTVICIALGGDENNPPRIAGLIAMADELRPDAPEAIRLLRAAGIQRIVMLTGDNERAARAVAQRLGIDEVRAALMPEDKLLTIREMEREAPVAMVGDGINDAPALAAASVGIAMGAAGTDVAMETADVVLMSNNLVRVPDACALSRHARRIVIQNLVFAMGVIIVLLMAALGPGILLPIGVVGHEGSTVLVCLNGLRLLFYDPLPGLVARAGA